MAATLSTRDRNKRKRREGILTAARKILIAEGYDGLTTRGLAEAAGVTVPTIYNLIGGKDEVLSELIADDVEQTWSQLVLPPVGPTLAAADCFIDLCVRSLDEREQSVRANILASDRVVGAYTSGADPSLAGSAASSRSVEMATHTVQALQQGGALRGDLAALTLGEQIFICFRDPLRDWGYGLISLGEFRRRLSRGVYMVLCSDATESIRQELVARINQLESEQGSPAPRAATGS